MENPVAFETNGRNSLCFPALVKRRPWSFCPISSPFKWSPFHPLTLHGKKYIYCWWFRNPANQPVEGTVVIFSHYLQGFTHPNGGWPAGISEPSTSRSWGWRGVVCCNKKTHLFNDTFKQFGLGSVVGVGTVTNPPTVLRYVLLHFVTLVRGREFRILGCPSYLVNWL